MKHCKQQIRENLQTFPKNHSFADNSLFTASQLLLGPQIFSLSEAATTGEFLLRATTDLCHELDCFPTVCTRLSSSIFAEIGCLLEKGHCLATSDGDGDYKVRFTEGRFGSDPEGASFSVAMGSVELL